MTTPAGSPTRPPLHPSRRGSEDGSFVVTAPSRRSRMGSIFDAFSQNRRSTIFNSFSALDRALSDLSTYLGAESTRSSLAGESISSEIDCLDYFQQELADELDTFPSFISNEQEQIQKSALSDDSRETNATAAKKELEQEEASPSTKEQSHDSGHWDVVVHQPSPKAQQNQVWSRWMALTNQAFTRIELAAVTIAMWCIPTYR